MVSQEISDAEVIRRKARADSAARYRARHPDRVKAANQAFRNRNRERLREKWRQFQRSRPRSYLLWINIKSRCYNKNLWAYEYYGARGIKLCDRWQSYENFVADLGEPPPGKSLDRINNNGDYEPGNVRWASRLDQCRNRRDSWMTIDRAIEIHRMRAAGVSLKSIAAHFGKPESTIGNALYAKSWRRDVAERMSNQLTVA